MREFPSPTFEEPSQKETPKKSLLKKMAEHPFAKPLLIAGALHLPLNETVGNAMAQAEHAAAEALKSPWERGSMVIDYQTKEQMDTVTARKTEREGRIDQSARSAYKLETEKNLEAGQGPSFKRMQFDLEKLNGVPADEVASAEQKADAMIVKYSAEVGDDLDADELKRISVEMYGPDDSYDPGQASVSSYFNTGERNCVAISRAQSVVLEGVLSHIPPEKRVHWRQTTQFVKQHEIAGLEHVGDDGQRDALFLLEGRLTRKWVGTEDEPGTAVVPMALVKKALVSSSVIEAKAAGNPSDVKDSPSLRLVTDEPASLNIHIDGKLKGAEFNVQETKRQGLEPRTLTEQEIAAIAAQEKKLEGHVIEVELLSDPGPAAARERLEDGMVRGAGYYDPETAAEWFMQGAVDARDYDMPSKETVAAFAESVSPRTVRQTKAWRVYYGTMENWSPEAIQQALQNNMKSISVQMKIDGRLSENFLREYRKAGLDHLLEPSAIKIEHGEADWETEAYINPEDLRVLLSVDEVKEVDLRDVNIGTDESRRQVLAVIAGMAADKTVIMPLREIGETDIPMIASMHGKMIVSCNDYALMIREHAEMIDSAHYTFDESAQQEELESLRQTLETFKPGHPALKRVEKLMKANQEAQPPQD